MRASPEWAIHMAPNSYKTLEYAMILGSFTYTFLRVIALITSPPPGSVQTNWCLVSLSPPVLSHFLQRHCCLSTLVERTERWVLYSIQV
jgi:hypothetical protein